MAAVIAVRVRRACPTGRSRTASGSTSLAMKLRPIPRVKMKVSRPRLTFLSCVMAARRRRPSRRRPGRGTGASAGPTSARWAATREGSSCAQRPRRAENSCASTMPMRDALAMNQPRRIVARDGLQGMPEGVAEIEQRAVARLRLVARARSPPWRGRRRRRRGRARGRPPAPARQCASSQRKKGSSSIRPYFATSA